MKLNTVLPEIKPTYQTGSLSIENLDVILELDRTRVNFGIQTAPNGKVWICVNGIALVRFTPTLGDSQK